MTIATSHFRHIAAQDQINAPGMSKDEEPLVAQALARIQPRHASPFIERYESVRPEATSASRFAKNRRSGSLCDTLIAR